MIFQNHLGKLTENDYPVLLHFVQKRKSGAIGSSAAVTDIRVSFQLDAKILRCSHPLFGLCVNVVFTKGVDLTGLLGDIRGDWGSGGRKSPSWVQVGGLEGRSPPEAVAFL